MLFFGRIFKMLGYPRLLPRGAEEFHKVAEGDFLNVGRGVLRGVP